ncbi:MAG: SDR family oxidoreductase [Planctomycetes bacterium]|nr:SDR family oxidoreductase [Planctomycetota bacterium]
MDLQLKGKTVFITGASGGIGRALARAFADEGCNLALHANSNLEWLRQFISGQAWHDRTIAVQADITDAESIQQAMDAGVARFGKVDVCVANAGKWPMPDELLSEMPVERFADTIAVNLLGAAFTARAFMRQITPALQGAALTFIGSTAGRFGEAMHSDYSAGKAGLLGLVRSLKNEVVRLDPFARVNMVEPGWTVTEMAREALSTPGKLTHIAKTASLRQLARAVDIARAVVMLSSPAASRHITGEVITVAGGMEGRTLWQPDQIDEEAIRRRVNE